MDYLITYCSLNYTYDFFQKNHPVITTVVKKKEKKETFFINSMQVMCNLYLYNRTLYNHCLLSKNPHIIIKPLQAVLVIIFLFFLNSTYTVFLHGFFFFLQCN